MLKNIFKLAVFVFLTVFLTASTPVFCAPDEGANIQETQSYDTSLQQNTREYDSEESANNTQESDIDRLNEEMGLGEQKQIVIDDVQSSPNDNTALTKKVVPDTKSELTKMVKMFLKVMLAVAISSVVIFVVLLFVRRFYSPVVTMGDLNKEDDKKISLDTPQNKNEALKTFLDKTKDI